MRNKVLILLTGCIILMGCRPRGVLSSRQMEDILVDLHTAEGMIQQAGYIYGHEEEERAYYLHILHQHHTTQSQFDSSLVWYTDNPTIFDKIYPKVLERLEAQQAAYQAKMEQSLQTSSKDVNQWLHEAQYGVDWLYWQKKYEKNDAKFVYVKKIL